ncbi:MAG: DNA-3-methyladenine glycosylase I [Aquabacterium sp.]|uniref:DNA-3-methyladenine glycosylase I n=1 Tax=Aquabacterium sp. TaxID=1872578 RepID=UPI00271A4BBD|nr:DNA-3-methyladenine glycosylase I [Aquabacterium sp.]MDO9003371.1 DNA-3-methyladenine glycosylase I [Aquabacterium sp.]
MTKLSGLFSDSSDASGFLRCAWCQATPAYQRYHDQEWGFAETDDRQLFEKLCLEGFQAGLSWLTILNKREAFRQAFAHFDVDQVARFGDSDIERLVLDAGIVRHRGKIVSTINNARRAIEIRDEFGSLASYFWRFEPTSQARPKRLTFEAFKAMPIAPEATALSKDLKKRGWTFVGPTTMYAFMQAMGMVNDHVEGCSVRNAASAARAALKPLKRPAS